MHETNELLTVWVLEQTILCAVFVVAPDNLLHPSPSFFPSFPVSQHEYRLRGGSLGGGNKRTREYHRRRT